ncbi:tripartite tricarboxylate transporter TctB family protein [Marinobacter sp.]|uniref:tripartite tricarboxylate transporter TctB family protein n=1 Tax=Marinobacter sp. TaxID=50741 RepID=UPI003A93450B
MLSIYTKTIFQLFLFVVSIGYLVTAINLGSPIAGGRLQPSFFPLILGSFSVLFGGILFFKEWIAVKQEKLTDTDDDGRNRFAAPIIIVSIFVYIVAFSAVGYFISSLFFVFAMLWVFSSKGKIVQKAAISVVIVTLGYLVFELLFGVRLPALGG